MDQGIVVIRLMPQTLPTPATKEIVVNAASGVVWTSRTLRKVGRNGVNESTPGEIGNDIGIFETSYPFMIGTFVTAPPYDFNLSHKVGNKQQSTSPHLVRQTQKMDAVIDRKFPNNLYLASIFSKAIGDKLSNGSIPDLYMQCSMNVTEYTVQTHTPKFVDMGLSNINALDEGSVLSNTATII